MRFMLVAFMLLTLIGCSSATSPTGAWQIMTINGVPVVGTQLLTLDIGNRSMKGFSGCNNFGRNVTIKSEAKEISFYDGATTLVGCAPDVQNQEYAIQDGLNTVKRYELSGDTLKLYDQHGREVMQLQRR